jgi:hypothetical protein
LINFGSTHSARGFLGSSGGLAELCQDGGMERLLDDMINLIETHEHETSRHIPDAD